MDPPARGRGGGGTLALGQMVLGVEGLFDKQAGLVCPTRVLEN